jgi:xanthine dehydrogenase YagR molybdenum-binding subunit
MGLPMERVCFRLGDSRLPVAPIEGGSSHVSTVGSAVQGVCEHLQKKLYRVARGLRDSPFAKVRLKDLRFREGRMEAVDEATGAVTACLPITDILAAANLERVEEKYLMLPRLLQQKRYTRATHSAVFCEVRVDEALGTVRVTRMVSAIAAGRIMNPRLARSQVLGGMVWGISQALHEETLADHRLGRFMNHNLAEYHVAVNADIHELEAIFVNEDDRIVSRLGAKGVGEIGIVGVAAAVSNAIFHATGRRLRSTPMTPDKVMAPDESWPAGDHAVGIPLAPR